MAVDNPSFRPSTALYCPADDLESLAYTLLAFRLAAHPPWHIPSLFPQEYDRREGKRFIKRRKKILAEMKADGTVEPVLFDFVEFARNLRPDKKISYYHWVNRMELASLR